MMPWWGGAVYNFVKKVEPKYVTLRVRAVNGLLLNTKAWDHHAVDTASRSHLLTEDHWKQADFTMFVFCPFNTTLGGRNPGEGTMTFVDFYPGECSPDGRLCSFLSRSRTKLFPKDAAADADLNTKSKTYFRGNFLV